MDDYKLIPLTRRESAMIWSSIILALAVFLGAVLGCGYWLGSQDRPCTPPEEIHP